MLFLYKNSPVILHWYNIYLMFQVVIKYVITVGHRAAPCGHLVTVLPETMETAANTVKPNTLSPTTIYYTIMTWHCYRSYCIKKNYVKRKYICL